MKTLIYMIGISMIMTTSLVRSSTEELNSSLETQLKDKSSDGKVLDSEGNEYRTVIIGNQTWLAENLRVTKFQDGSKVSTGFIPDDDESLLTKYGRLYNWKDVSDKRNLCPDGWRVASDEDWQELEKSIGIEELELNTLGWRGKDDTAITLKAHQPDTLFKQFDQSMVNKYNFSATPAGVKLGNWYITQGMYTEFWTSTNASEKEALARTLAYSWWNSHKGEIRRATLNKSYMFSVRCVKD
ncbi:hypothetical protein HII17_14565 [Thalassotalea sp. M1531]|uniref:Fibrobacter succinogenes major paralogous domain-containing protein n=1 Tax=Thalassotalea algicola TaxID=2716224 RepID=A0A7Y0Q8C8_9GAMM|nr:fibrobacter succinogenes major paralogous domain-containing protein [Thalassotalea algicola]NMP32777.1 hypothetical protein [Thalassotalea algicola]